MFWDTHLHCNFSGDSSADPEDMIRSAIEKNLDGICFTDHIDWDYPGTVLTLITRNIMWEKPKIWPTGSILNVSWKIWISLKILTCMDTWIT